MPRLEDCLAEVEAGRMVPYLGPGVAALAPGGVPASPAELCARIEAEVRPPRRARGNLWAVAQFVESRRFRATLADIVVRAFAGGAAETPLHAWLARVRPPLAVDAWYDSGLVAAMGRGPADWGLVQGVSRDGNGLGLGAWTRAYCPDGAERRAGPDPAWRSLVYMPHGLARPGGSFLVSDSDYVEVLTEIDIQTPIPEEVRRRRTGRGFLFLGCRFDDQTLRIFARQILKRSGGPRVAVIEGELTRMEARFLAEQGIARIDLPLAAVVGALGLPA